MLWRDVKWKLSPDSQGYLGLSKYKQMIWETDITGDKVWILSHAGKVRLHAAKRKAARSNPDSRLVRMAKMNDGRRMIAD